jgi:stage II sporulation protein AA (anti-sigma F factor antagonist)
MRLRYSELENSIRLIKLIGALDLSRTYSIEVEFVHHCAGEGVRVLVDLSEVDYISSIGVQMLVNAANSIASRGGKMALFSPQPSVLDVLDLTGILQVISIYSDLESAEAGVLAK